MKLRRNQQRTYRPTYVQDELLLLLLRRGIRSLHLYRLVTRYMLVFRYAYNVFCKLIYAFSSK
jgi:hypothetical protein